MTYAKLLAVAAVIVLATSMSSLSQGQAPRFLEETVEDGHYVFVYKDGTASVVRDPSVLKDRWAIDCHLDAMTDQLLCGLNNGSGGILVYYANQAEPIAVCIVDHDFPGKAGMLRVDSHEAQKTSNLGCVAAANIVDQLITGKNLLTRRYEFPNKTLIDRKTSLWGFAKALEIVERIRSQ